MSTDASGKVEQAGDSASLELVARAGLIAYGVVVSLPVMLVWRPVG